MISLSLSECMIRARQLSVLHAAIARKQDEIARVRRTTCTKRRDVTLARLRSTLLRWQHLRRVVQRRLT